MALSIVRTAAALRAALAPWRREGRRIGFVPTMGALHRGHAALVERALASCDRVVVSVFVNPTQFAPNEDFARYPRTEAADAALLERVGAHVLYAPSVEEIYPPGDATRVTVAGLTETMEGAIRPHFFTGVATVCARLFSHVQPEAAFFGEKDYQQLLVVRRMVRDLGFGLEVIAVPTVREPDGLALSSRNAYLSAAERRAAPTLHRVLQTVAAGLRDGAAMAGLRPDAVRTLRDAGFAEPDYLDLRDAETLAPLDRLDAAPARLLVAARLGATRLIDNIAVQRA
ncbi:pantoate--beta-alanine ligase [Elioraea sp. Yellowstone]|jgi:pantoate--beta-alanine ligase|uniref:pantoate--beta-alanine ligase n=1 Tax=Elioraea sp. Yellowstone TaxID=2592070 RepID=UPI00115374B3|nr:pantoate--beta-alanine ligase [Elioraea sp. Yellowstone]TQF76686.1 pantoate--beta-alanine ligase [Elioraea sp. Yellowstone]